MNGARMDGAPPSGGLEAALFGFLRRPDLGRYLFVIALLLTSTALFSGYALDDYIARYLYVEDDAEARRLFRWWTGGYGVADGNPDHNRQLVEEGWAPWWIVPDLKIRLYRPLSRFTHELDGMLWPESPPLLHLHSMLWMGLLVLAVTRLYRVAMAPRLLAGMAALLFAVDHTHGFIVGYVTNRHALLAGLFAALCLTEYIRSRQGGPRYTLLTGPLCLVLGVLSSESTIAVGAYMGAYALFVDRSPLLRRALSLLPYAAVVLVWMALYKAGDYGAYGSGLYIDPAKDPLAFWGAFLRRGPVLLLGQYLVPPAETYLLLGPSSMPWMVAGAYVFVGFFAFALVPLVARDRLARFWLLGSLLAMVPAAAAHPHNRQLLFVSLGAMALVGQLWHLYAVERRNTGRPGVAQIVASLVLLIHLVASPFALPLATYGPAFSKPLHQGMHDVGDEVVGKDVVFITAPDYFAVKLILLDRRIRDAGLPRRVRSLSFGPEQVTVHRTAPNVLTLDIEGGILTDEMLELYRDHRIPTPVGRIITLKGMEVDVQAVTDAGLAKRVRFTFDTALSDERFLFYYWKQGGGFDRFEPPPVGEAVKLPKALFNWSPSAPQRGES